METVYLLALAGVALAIVAAVAEAVIAVLRRPRWSLPRWGMASRLSPVDTVDRRHGALPYVGADRRQVDTAAPADPAHDRAAA